MLSYVPVFETVNAKWELPKDSNIYDLLSGGGRIGLGRTQAIS